MNNVLVSIVMPVRNCEHTVAAAVQSILNQSFRELELIVIDDGSNDGTFAQLHKFRDERIRVLHYEQSKGLPVRLNEGIDIAKGMFWGRMDGDDVCYPNRLQSQLEYLRVNPNVDLVGSGAFVFGNGGRPIGKRIPPSSHEQICRRPYSSFGLIHPTFLGKTAWFSHWRFDERAAGACDQELLLRSFQKSRFANVPEILLGYRENHIVLNKSLGYRMAVCRRMLASSKGPGLTNAVLGLVHHTGMTLVEAFAVLTGLQHRILRHRATPATSLEIKVWREVWGTLTPEYDRVSAEDLPNVIG